MLPLLYVVIAMASVQSGASLAKQLFPVLGATGTVALRVTLAALILTALLCPWRQPVARAKLPALIVYGASLAGMNICFYLSLRTIPLGPAVAIEFVGPLAVVLIHSRRLLDLLWLGLAIAGLILMLPAGITGADLDPVGALLAFAAGVCWGIYIVSGQRAGAENGMQAAALGMLVAAAIALPVGAPALAQAQLSPALALVAVGVAVLSSVVPYTLEMIALRRLPPQTFGMLMSLEPAVATLAGFTFLGERLTATELFAIALVMLASIGATLATRSARTDLPPTA